MRGYAAIVGIVVAAQAVCVARAETREDYSAIDRHALAAGPQDEASIDSLARYLGQRATTDVEKARIIFRWLGDRMVYDVEAYLRHEIRDVSPDNVFASRSAVCQGFASLFEALGKRLGLEVLTVQGYAKGYGHVVKTAFDQPNHAWNAVRIDGRWYWIDATWGAGYVRDGAYIRKVGENFFMIDPDHWRLTHLPEEGGQEVFRPAISKAEFEELPSVPFSLLAYDLPSQKLLDTIRQPGFRDFVGTYEQAPGEVRIDNVPLQRHLAADVPVEFKLRSDVMQEVVAVAGEAWLPFVRRGEYFELLVKPPKGALNIAGRKAEQQDFTPFLSYEVE